MPKPNQDQFVLQPNFSHLIFYAFVTIPHQYCTKTIISLIHQFCYQGKKTQSMKLAKTKPNQDQFHLQPNFSHLIFYAFVTICHQHCTKTITSLIHQFCYQGKKSKSPKLAKTKPNQDQFLLQSNFLHLIFDAFVTIPHQDCTKTITSVIHQFCFRGKKANPPNVAKPKPNQDQFLLQPKFSNLIFYAFLTIHHQDCTKTITSVNHQFC